MYYSNGEWKISVSLPEQIRINLHDFITLEMDTDTHYKYHAEVIKKYPSRKAVKHKKKKGKGKNKW